MKRSTMKAMIAWKESPDRKPLVLRGARQTGKTWLMKEFGKEQYENTAYFNFDEEEELKSLFQTTKNPQRLLDLLALLHGTAIKPGKTLIIFDEIQECPEALNALKYFREQAGAYHVVAAGSLLGTYLSQYSYPVGQVDLLELYPLTFAEFLEASDENLYDIYRRVSKGTVIPDLFHTRFLEAYRTYLIIGGMPECVKSWVSYKDAGRVAHIQQDILTLYENDFTKHNSKIDAGRILLVYRSLIPQLSKENKKFSYSLVKKGARAREYEEAVEWLVSAGILYRIHNVSMPGYPLKSYEIANHFKLYFLDTGLLKAMGQVENEAILFDKDFAFKGAMAENFVLQQFLGTLPALPHYFSPDSRMEIDFLLQYKTEIIPVEVKAGSMRQAASFRKYIEKYHPVEAVRYSIRNYKTDGAFTNIPLYLAGRTDLL